MPLAYKLLSFSTTLQMFVYGVDELVSFTVELPPNFRGFHGCESASGAVRSPLSGDVSSSFNHGVSILKKWAAFRAAPPSIPVSS